MQTEERTIVVSRAGIIEVPEMPVQAGDRVRVVVFLDEALAPDPQVPPPAIDARYPLRGRGPYRFESPTDPVAPDDWEPE